MIIFKKREDVINHLNKIRKEGKKIGFVPTMGALHEGHLSLIDKSEAETDVTVCSIFVNPTQFNDVSDFEKYPVTVARDTALLSSRSCDILFLPGVEDIYPDGTKITQKPDFGFIAETLEGAFRPGHFDGMAQVVEILLRIIGPCRLYMGLKDFQQQLIVAKLIEMRQLPVTLSACPTSREPDGLALSSRNIRLHETARKKAGLLSRTLAQCIQKLAELRKVETANAASITPVEHKAALMLKKDPDITLEYFAVRNAKTLHAPVSLREPLVVLVAAKIGGVRLIDNMILE